MSDGKAYLGNDRLWQAYLDALAQHRAAPTKTTALIVYAAYKQWSGLLGDDTRIHQALRRNLGLETTAT